MSHVDGEVVEVEGLAARVPAHGWLVGSAVFHYLGPSFAVLLFARVPVAGVAWLRIVAAAVVFAVWRRPWRGMRVAPPSVRRHVVALGATFAAMNLAFYCAIDRLPLGTVAAVEFLGPLALALAGARTARNLVAVAAAVAGVALLADVHLAADRAGFAWAFANAALFTVYIAVAHRVAGLAGGPGPIDRLGAAMLVAAVAVTPLGLAGAVPALADPGVLAAGAAVGVTSSVIPYVCDQMAMRRVPRATYALFVSLLPASAVAVGAIVLAQVPQPAELVAVACVIAGVAVHRPSPEPRSTSAARPASRR